MKKVCAAQLTTSLSARWKGILLAVSKRFPIQTLCCFDYRKWCFKINIRLSSNPSTYAHYIVRSVLPAHAFFKSILKNYDISFPSLLNNFHHFFWTHYKWFYWKIFDVSGYKECFDCLARIHCNFVKNYIVWISWFFLCCNARKFFSVFNNVLNDRINYFIGKFKLLPMQNFFVFSYNFFTVNWLYNSS